MAPKSTSTRLKVQFPTDSSSSSIEIFKMALLFFSWQGLLTPLKKLLPWFQGIVTWERPAANIVLIVLVVLVIYKWVPQIFPHFIILKPTNLILCSRSHHLTPSILQCREWVGKALAAFLLWMVAGMFLIRHQRRIQSNDEKIVICTASDQSTMENIVSAQQGLRTVHEVMQQMNITILKLYTILTARSPKVSSLVSAEKFSRDR